MLDSQRVAVNFSALFPGTEGRKKAQQGAFPGQAQNPLPFWRIFLEADEADISTFEYQTQAQARFPRTHGHQGRSKDTGRSPLPWPRPTHPRLTPFPAQMTASGQHARFPKSSRIQASADFRAIREQGKRLAKGCMLANWQSLPSGSPSRLGVITSRRIGKAHVRNRARRLMRESFRLHQHELLQPVELILVARRSIADRQFQSVERHFLSLLKKAGLLPEKAAPAYPATP